MNSTPKPRLRKRPQIIRWHWRLGLLTIPLALWLVLSGLILNHSNWLELDQRTVGLQWVLDAYRIPQPQLQTFVHDQLWISDVEEAWYLNQARIGGELSTLRGIWPLQSGLALIGERHLAWLDNTGALLELAGSEALPGRILQVGEHTGQLLVRSEHGLFLADAEVLSWHPLPDPPSSNPYPDTHFNWQQGTTSTPQEIKQALIHSWRQHQLHWERVLLDLHAGRVWGPIGSFLATLGSLGLLLLCLSGLWMWWQRR